MAYEKTIWKNREVERPRTFMMQNNPDGTVTLIPAEGEIIEPGTPIIAENMNKIEQGIKDAHDELAAHKAENASQHGDLTTLKTSQKSSLVEAINELFTNVSDGKNQLETAITDKGGTVSKSGNIATFDELDNGIRSIPVGDYAVGGTIRDSVLRFLPGGMGVEIWSKTDVGFGWGIAVDSAGNVYVTHHVSSGGKAVRKLDSAGNEIWSRTDVGFGQGIAVDSAGNVYVTHGVSSGKTVRKLDSAGNEIWSRTDVGFGQGIAVDSAGNVYVAHYVDSGGKAVRKLDSAGNEIWSKTDVGFGQGIAVDSAGNVYVTHHVSSGGKTVRKLDSAGNEIWSRTGVEYGQGIAVDSAGNVYVTHNVDSGEKAVRKLDSAGNVIWSKTDVGFGRGIAVDSAGNVYVAHYVSSGKAVRKLDGNRYFQIVG